MNISTIAKTAIVPAAAAILLAGTGVGAASAQSVYNPNPSDLATPPAVNSGHWIKSTKALSSDSSSHLTFSASKSSVNMQQSTTPPKQVKGRWTMGASQPAVLHGTSNSQGGFAQDATIGNYSFDKYLTGLKSNTRYYLLLTVPTGAHTVPVQKIIAYDTTLLANTKTDRTDVWAKHHFVSNSKKVQFRWGASAYKAATATPVTLTGTKISPSGQPNKYAFTRKITNLQPAAQYFTQLNTAATPTQSADSQLGNFWTKTRHVSATVKSIHVIDDADGAFRGAGDLAFYLRINKSDDPSEKTQWSGKSDNMSIKSGSTATGFGRNLTQSRTNPANKLLLLVQGVEDDTLPTTKKACHLNDYFGHKAAANQSSKSLCYDASFAQGYVNLPTTKYTGTHTQTAHLQVYRSPALRFTVEVTVATWFE